MTIHQMQYPSDFVLRVKAEFPFKKELHLALDRGAQFVGRMLEEAAGFQIDPSMVISLIDSGQLAALREQAAAAVRRRSLYLEWGRLYDEQVKPLLRDW